MCSMLLESGVCNLGVNTEMLTDGIIDLYRAGRITGTAKRPHGQDHIQFCIGVAGSL